MCRKQADESAVNNLKALGSDNQKVQPVEFFLYFASEWDAYVVKSQLMNLQFSTSVQYSKGSEQWLCLAQKEVTPTTERLTQLGNFLEKLAAGNNGNYDGWGTAVEIDK